MNSQHPTSIQIKWWVSIIGNFNFEQLWKYFEKFRKKKIRNKTLNNNLLYVLHQMLESFETCGHFFVFLTFLLTTDKFFLNVRSILPGCFCTIRYKIANLNLFIKTRVGWHFLRVCTEIRNLIHQTWITYNIFVFNF